MQPWFLPVRYWVHNWLTAAWWSSGPVRLPISSQTTAALASPWARTTLLILTINGLKVVTAEVVEAARESMNISKVAPELRRPLRMLPPVPIGNALGRRLIRALGGLMPATKVDGVTIERRNNLQPRLRIYRPTMRHSKGALYWIHGGGMVIGSAAQDDRLCSSTARELG